MNYITCFTGHRPEAFPWGADKDDPRCKILFNRSFSVAPSIPENAKYFSTGLKMPSTI